MGRKVEVLRGDSRPQRRSSAAATPVITSACCTVTAAGGATGADSAGAGSVGSAGAATAAGDGGATERLGFARPQAYKAIEVQATSMAAGRTWQRRSFMAVLCLGSAPGTLRCDP